MREHGGLGAVKRRWECLSFYAEPVPRSYAERSIASRQRQIDESHAALRRRNERIAELERELDELDDICDGMSVKDTLEEALNLCATIGCEPSSAVGEELIWALGECTDIVSKRLMPEGMEWMLWDDGRPVTYDDAPDDVVGVYLALDGSGYALMTDLPAQLMSEPSERVKRPAKVLDADGVEIREGDEVWTDYGDGPWTVTSITTDHAWHVHGESDELGSLDMPPSTLTHRAPVLAADGKPLREGETVYHVNSGIEYSVRSVTNGGAHLSKGDKSGGYCQADYLTHERPVVDTWERLEEDADALAEAEINGEGSFNTANDYCTRHGLKDGTVWVLVAQDLVRRAKALAERDAK